MSTQRVERWLAEHPPELVAAMRKAAAVGRPVPLTDKDRSLIVGWEREILGNARWVGGNTIAGGDDDEAEAELRHLLFASLAIMFASTAQPVEMIVVPPPVDRGKYMLARSVR